MPDPAYPGYAPPPGASPPAAPQFVPSAPAFAPAAVAPLSPAPSPWAALTPLVASVGRFLSPQTVLLLALFGGYVGYQKWHADPAPAPAPAPTPTVDAVKLGRAYVPEVAAAYGDGCLAAAEAIEAGKTMAEAQVATQKAFLDSRTAAFERIVGPEMDKVIDPGTEPDGPAHRAAVVKFWRNLSRGLKGGR